MAAVYIRNPIVPGKAFVEEGVVSFEQVHEASVVTKPILKKQRRLLLECLPQVVVELGKDHRVGRHRPHVAQV